MVPARSTCSIAFTISTQRRVSSRIVAASYPIEPRRRVAARSASALIGLPPSRHAVLGFHRGLRLAPDVALAVSLAAQVRGHQRRTPAAGAGTHPCGGRPTSRSAPTAYLPRQYREQCHARQDPRAHASVLRAGATRRPARRTIRTDPMLSRRVLHETGTFAAIPGRNAACHRPRRGVMQAARAIVAGPR
jgi:hypothetical protein